MLQYEYMIQEVLKKIGFNEKEVEIYLEALHLGRATPARIAKNTGINRTTVYSVAKGLIQKGVLTEDYGQKYTYIVALPPEQLHNILDKKKRAIREEEKLLDQALEELSSLPSNTQFSIPKIRFVEELDLEDYLYKKTDEWNASAKKADSTWWGFQDHTLVANYKSWIDDFWTKRPSAENIRLKMFSNPSEIEKRMVEKNIDRREINFWGAGKNFTSTFWVIGDYVIMIYTQNRPFYLIEIYNPVMAHNLREVFKNLWEEIKKK